MSSTKPDQTVVVRFGDSILAELKGPTRRVEFKVSVDYFWENVGTQDNPKWSKTTEECLAIAIGGKSAHRFEPTKKNVRSIIDALEMAMKELI